MFYYDQQQEQQQAAMLQQYNSATAAAGYPQYLQYAHNPMIPAGTLYSRPEIDSSTFQSQPQPVHAKPDGQGL